MSRSRRRSQALSSLKTAGRAAPVGIRKTPDEIDAIAASGALLAAAHEAMAAHVAVGVTTAELDEIAEQVIRDGGGIPAFKGYGGSSTSSPFPATICSSVNDQVVHGIPGAYALADGDLLAIDCGVVLDGWVSDAARSYAVGTRDPEVVRLIEVTGRALERGIAAATADARVGDIGHAVQTEVEAAGFSCVETLVGHGVGRSMHEPPNVPNVGTPGTGEPLFEGLVIAIEPMVNAGGPDVTLTADGWTIVTADGSLSAHIEHTIAVTASGPRILT
ncbi:MAG: type I methionyl aminopeptidase [Actinobacteria bacterium]|nr:type I methionyl aminopeptidase [Thermoleophilia bacterium]MCB9010451.1 type I methionyl aminopeptidase [Actinomycetota bacterium]